MKRKIVDSNECELEVKRVKTNKKHHKSDSSFEDVLKVKINGENEDELTDNLAKLTESVEQKTKIESTIKSEEFVESEKSEKMKLIESIEKPDELSKSEIKTYIKLVIKYINEYNFGDDSSTMEKYLDFLITMMESKRKRHTSIMSKINVYQFLSLYNGTLSNKDQKIKHILLQSDFQNKRFHHNIFGNYVNLYFDVSEEGEYQLNKELNIYDLTQILNYDKLIKTCYNFPIIYDLPDVSGTFTLLPESSDKYDPYYLLTWILENFFEFGENSSLNLSKIATDARLFIRFKFIHFLIACHTCQQVKAIRVLANKMLSVVVTKLLESAPSKEELSKSKAVNDVRLYEIAITQHACETFDNYKVISEKVPRVITNFYLKMLKMASKTETPVFTTLYEMTTKKFKGGFKNCAFPIMKLSFHSKEFDASSFFAWVVNLMCISVKDRVDFQLFHSTHVFTDILEELHSMDLPLQVMILGLLKSCVYNEKIVKTLMEKYDFMNTICVFYAKFKSNKDLYDNLVEVANQLVETVDKSVILKKCEMTRRLVDDIRMVFKMDSEVKCEGNISS